MFTASSIGRAPRDTVFFSRPLVVVALSTLCCMLWGSSYPAIKTGYALLGISQQDMVSGLLLVYLAALVLVCAGVLLVTRGAPTGATKRSRQQHFSCHRSNSFVHWSHRPPGHGNNSEVTFRTV